MIKIFHSLLPFLVLTLSHLGCSKKILAPPKIDLKSYGRLGIVQFQGNAKGNLNQTATRKFVAYIHGAQPGIPIVEIGNLGKEPSFQDIIQMKKEYGVDAVFLGALEVSKIKPKVRLTAFNPSVNVKAKVHANLNVRLCESIGGASIWSNNSWAENTVAGVSIGSDGIEFGAQDPEKSYGNLLQDLIYYATWDLRSQWVKK